MSRNKVKTAEGNDEGRKLKMHTPDLTAQNIEKLAALFPNCVTEAKDEATRKLKRAIDFDQLRQELSDHIVDGPRERYHLDWPGKREALLAANAPIAKTLRPCREESVDFDTTKNLFIEGDNLDALKLLQETYLGKVKMIYIDPPYNTGKQFIYDDEFNEDAESYLIRSNQKSNDDYRMIANPESNGRFHSDWLTMIYSRLRLSRNLLADDGLIFISIDDHEVANLKAICDEIFGEANFIAKFVWNTEGHTDNQFDVKVNHEYILLYAKNSHDANLGHVVDPNTRSESNLWKGFAENSITKNGPGNPPSSIELPAGFPCLAETLDLPNTIVPKAFNEAVEEQGYISRELTEQYDISYPIRLDRMKVAEHKLKAKCVVYSGWANANKLKAFIANGCAPIVDKEDKVSFYLSEKGVIYYRRDREKARNILSVVRNMSTTEKMRSELEEMGIPFQYPKPKELLRYLLQIGSESDDLVLDFFAGSGSTAHAAMLQNAEDRLHRRWILVQIPEVLDLSINDQKIGAKFCAKLGVPSNVAEISKERLRRCGKKVKQANATTAPNLDIGFRVLKIDTSNMADVYYAPDAVKQADLIAHTDNIKPDRTPEDLLFQVLVDWGIDLSLPMKKETFSFGKERKDEGTRMKVEGKSGGEAAKKDLHNSSFIIQPFEVFFVDGNALAACFDPNITEELVKEIAQRKPLRAVFRDSSFDSDSTKINVEQIFKLLSPETEVKTL